MVYRSETMFLYRIAPQLSLVVQRVESRQAEKITVETSIGKPDDAGTWRVTVLKIEEVST